MSTKQLTFHHSLYENIKESHKRYAKKILYKLYSDKSLSELSIISKFTKKHSKIVKSSIKDLKECNLIKNSNTSKSPGIEKNIYLPNLESNSLKRITVSYNIKRLEIF